MMTIFQRIAIVSSLFIACVAGFSQTIVIDTIEVIPGDPVEIVWLQIPEDYDSTIATPLLFGWHGWGGDHLQMSYMTSFDEDANRRGWFAASMCGPNPFHWNTHTAQSHCVQVLNWIDERYNVDHHRIYMVGGSMGGAAGMIFSNNHLDPTGWMVAATASGSGIMDCHRRFLEQGINYTMMENFGGSPRWVPYQYHRHSAVYFADSSESMHVNMRHLPMYYTFGYNESPWMEHALDLYDIIHPIADTVYLVEAVWPGHGWESMDPIDIGNWLENFILNDNPDDISINADEDGRYYWVHIDQWDSTEAFTRFDASYDSVSNSFTFHGWWNLEWAMFELDMMGISTDSILTIEWTVDDTVESLVLPGYNHMPEQVLKNGTPTNDWTYEAFWNWVTITSGTGYSVWEIYPHVTSVPSKEPAALLNESDIISRAWPNPFNPILHLIYQVKSPGQIHLSVFNILGREVAVLADGYHANGTYRTVYDGSNHSSGIYLINLRSETNTYSVKALLLK